MTWVKKINQKDIHPGLVNVINLTLDKLQRQGTPFKVYSGLRTFAEQDKLYAQGRTTGGSIVTNARGGQSMHNYGLAVDLAPYNMLTEDPTDLWWPEPESRNGEIWYQLEKKLHEAAAEVDASSPDNVEYEWGGRWKFRDVPHCQIKFTLSQLEKGEYPHCNDVFWLSRAHTTFLYGTDWMNKRVQYLLNMLSYNVGDVDGIFGSNTRKAMIQFQSDNSLDTVGVITKPTVDRLVRLHQKAISTR